MGLYLNTSAAVAAYFFLGKKMGKKMRDISSIHKCFIAVRATLDAAGVWSISHVPHPHCSDP